MKQKCNCKAAKLESEKIVLELNNDFFDNICCFLCGNITTPDGLDFVIEGTKDFVCLDCAKNKAPELYLIHKYAHQWREKYLTQEFNEGCDYGKTIAGQMILDAITETTLERVKRVCRVELGVKAYEDVPF